jgi:AAA family ATP:ADP antiporter
MSAAGGAERDAEGREHLGGQSWQKMGTKSWSTRAGEYLARVTNRVTGDMDADELLRVAWLSSTLFFVVGGYWLLRSLKDPIMSAIDGVEYIPQAKIASLFVVFGLVIVYNKLLDILPKHQLFYVMGGAYGVLFTIMGLLLLHPTIGLANTKADPTRFLGWLSYVTIESFGSMVVQCYWALVNASVDVNFAKKNFGLIVAGAQIGSILGPTVATQASVVGIPVLYLFGAVIMFLMIGAMYFYVQRFGIPAENEEENAPEAAAEKKAKKSSKSEEGILEGFYLFNEHDYVKGIFAISSLFMVQVTIIDYMMKVLAKDRYALLYPDDPQEAMRGFASFMGYFGQTTNSISFLFSLFGTGAVIQRFGLTTTLVLFPVLLLICTVFVWIMPNIWVVFTVMMIIKGMSYALNNPTKEILYQMTSTQIKFKCKSWIDTFGQRSSKAGGSIVTNAFATSLVDLNK